ncbi:hypothetical protein AB0467_28300 [Streptomyces sp. NPDC052095]|uniref:hypothetical protein n=1 Tax=unclassified Streptomyces TaxID=2593676 RepID=UPI00344EA7F9
MTTIWRDSEGRHWAECGHGYDGPVRVTGLTAAEQDPSTGRWAAAEGGPRAEVAGPPGAAGYAPVADDPYSDPLFARLHHLVDGLLAEVERLSGRPHPRADELRTVLEDATAVPQALRRSLSAARAAGSRAGYHRGRAAGRRR